MKPVMMLKHHRRALHVAVTALLLGGGCEGLQPKETPVMLTKEQEAAHWVEVQRRVPAWFLQQGKAVPDLPTPETVFSKVRIFEFGATPGTTCYFDPPGRIEIGNDKWGSGCVPHELGHALLYIMGNPCWNEFEHPGETC